jgi:hypothetical protein
MKFTNAKPVLEMTRSEATIIYNFLMEVMQGEILDGVDYVDRIEDFTAQYEDDVDSDSESLLSFILKIKD